MTRVRVIYLGRPSLAHIFLPRFQIRATLLPLALEYQKEYELISFS